MKRIRSRKYITKKTYFSIFLVFIVLVTFIFYFLFNLAVSPKLVHIANLKLDDKIKEIASNYEIYNSLNSSFDNLFIVTLNDKKEILTLDYQMEEIYKMSKVVTDNLFDTIYKIGIDDASFYLNKKIDMKQQDSIILMLPIGIVSNFVFLNNLGPRIPVIIHFINSVFTNVQTRLTNYGINNALLEVYLDVSLKYEIITPVLNEEKNLDFTILLGAKVIQGTVPEWYGNEMITKSSCVKNEYFMI